MYTAIVTRKFRDTNTTTPKVILDNLVSPLNREHCHVLMDEIEKFIPAHGHVCIIKFTADIKKYLKRGIEECETLHNIKVLKYKFKRVSSR